MVRSPGPREDVIHAQIVAYCLSALPRDAVFHHSPNEGKRGWRSQRWLKQSGVCPGWPDLEIHYRGRTLFLEVKSATGTLSDAQKATFPRLIAAGFQVEVVRSLDEAMRVLADFAKWARAA